MAMQTARNLLLILGLVWATPALASEAGSLAGTTLKFSHVVNETDGGYVSDTVSVSVTDKASTNIRTAHGYVITVSDKAVKIRFTHDQYWPGCGLFNGLVIEDIAWPDTPKRYMADATLEHKMASKPDDILTRQFNRVLIDFRGLKVRANDTLTLRITTGTLKD